MRVGIAAGIGALAGLALSYVSLSPLIAGGIIGFAAPLVFFVIHACCGFRELVSSNAIGKGMSEKHQQVLREYENSTECKVKACTRGIVDMSMSFGIGAGLVILGLTSSAAIGAVTAIASLVILYPLGFVIDKVIECFFPDGNGKQPDSLVGDMEVDNVDENRNPEQPQYC